MRAMLSLRAALAVLAVMVAAPALATGNEAHNWLRRMNFAVADLNYDGWFVHQVGGRSERLRIIHRKRDGHMSERVITTDGSGREFVRNGSEYVEYHPDSRVLVQETRTRSYGFLVALNGLAPDTERYYHITTGGTERLIGRNAVLVRVEPRDGLRFGYRFWLDQQTALPLKTQMVSRAGEVLEEITFVSLSQRVAIPDELLQPDVDTTNFKRRQRDVPTHNPAVKAAFRAREGALPAGFRVRIFSSPEDEAAKGPRTRFIVSDGVAWVSVFVANDDPQPEGAPPAGGRPGADVAVFGALAAYAAHTKGYKVTGVGEVPPATIRAIVEAFQPE